MAARGQRWEVVRNKGPHVVLLGPAMECGVEWLAGTAADLGLCCPPTPPPQRKSTQPQEFGGGWAVPCPDSQAELLNSEGKPRSENHIEGRQGKGCGRDTQTEGPESKGPGVSGRELGTPKAVPLVLAGAS